MRVCGWCGVPEQRWREDGRDRVNLDPVNSLCMACLIEYAKGTPRPSEGEPTWRDHRTAQAGRDE